MILSKPRSDLYLLAEINILRLQLELQLVDLRQLLLKLVFHFLAFGDVKRQAQYAIRLSGRFQTSAARGRLSSGWFRRAV